MPFNRFHCPSVLSGHFIHATGERTRRRGNRTAAQSYRRIFSLGLLIHHGTVDKQQRLQNTEELYPREILEQFFSGIVTNGETFHIELKPDSDLPSPFVSFHAIASEE